MVASRASRVVFALILVTLGAWARADSCTECKSECDHGEKAMECVSEAMDNSAGNAACAALIVACIARCSCPDPARVQACFSEATKRHSERAMSCLRQFPTNPTGCTDQNNENYQSEVARCRVDP